MAAGFIYVLPLPGEDWLKLGTSNDPLRRAREFSSRFYDLFDFDQAFLVECDDSREAARLERDLHRQFRVHRSPVPLAIARAAGGHTEWLRGAYPGLSEAAVSLAGLGHTLHLPAAAWYRAAMGQQQDQLHDWASALLREHLVDPEGPAPDPIPGAAAAVLVDAIEGFHRFGWRVGPRLPAALQAWYAARWGG